MPRTTLLASLTAFLLTAAQCLPAQQPTLAPGDRVRVTFTDAAAAQTLGARRWEATFVGETADSVVLQQAEIPEPVTIPRTDLAQIERFAGRKGKVGKGAAIGAGVGAVVGIGALIGGATAACDGFDCIGTGLIAMAGLVTVPVGALLGAAIGAASPSDRWEALLPDVKVAPTVIQGVPGIALSIPF